MTQSSLAIQRATSGSGASPIIAAMTRASTLVLSYSAFFSETLPSRIGRGGQGLAHLRENALDIHEGRTHSSRTNWKSLTHRWIKLGWTFNSSARSDTATLHPTKPVTVEFGVERIGVPDTLTRVGEDPDPPIIAKSDNYLPGGGTLTAIFPPRVYKKLLLPAKDAKRVPLTAGKERQQVIEHVEKHGIRVTGVLRDKGFDQYVIVIEDPANVVLYIAGSGM